MRPTDQPALLITCEHGGNAVPVAYQKLFEGQDAVLTSHRGYDHGALELGEALAAVLQAPYLHATVTRLLIDLNRSPGHRHLYSEFTANLPRVARAAIEEQFYLPHRQRVQAFVQSRNEAGQSVLHIASHSFTPTWQGKERTADVGLLYDPRRSGEQRIVCLWQEELRKTAPEFHVRRNYPYLGRADGLTKYLRMQFKPERYLGIELEVNQRWALGSVEEWKRLKHVITVSLSRCLRGIL